MTTTTLAAINSQSGIELRTVVAIEGIPYLLVDDESPAVLTAAVTAWAGFDWTQALGGLEIQYNLDQRLSPWKPWESTSSSVTLTVADVSGTNADTLGLLVFKREGMNSSPLASSLTPTTAEIPVLSSDAFAASGVGYIGCETFIYDTNDTGTDTFQDVARGRYTPFLTQSSAGFARTHSIGVPLPGIDPYVGTTALVADAPLDWRGRFVAVHLHRVVGGVLDVKAQSHRVFAGTIASVADARDGRLVIRCDDIRQRIKDAQVLRHQWRAKLKPGVYLNAGVRFTAHDRRLYVSGGVTHDDRATADALEVVPSGASPPNQLNEGHYEGGELESAINQWLAAERVAVRLLLKQVFRYQAQDLDGNARSTLYFSDPDTSDAAREWQLTCTSPTVRAFFGWADEGIGSAVATESSGIAFSATEPLRIAPVPSGFLHLTDVQGEFVDQSAFMRPNFANRIPGGATGIVRIGSAIMVCGTPTGTAADGELEVNGAPNMLLNTEFNAGETTWPSLEADRDGNVEAIQILALDSDFKTLVLALLASTGSTDFNWTGYDALPASCSAEVPYDLMTTDMEDELDAVPLSGDQMCVVIKEPTPLSDIWNVSDVLRGIQLIWKNGRLGIAAFATPTSAATITVAIDDRATPLDTADDMRAVTVETDALMVNCITIKSDGNPLSSEYRTTTTIVDAGSASTYGSAPVTLTARNAVKGSAAVGEDVLGLLQTFVPLLAFLGRPMMMLRFPIPQTLIEQLTPGTTFLLSDDFARDPATGRRGLTSKPALVLGSRCHGWGAQNAPAVGEVDAFIFPRLSLAPWSPCARVDETVSGGGFTAGYNNGATTLRCKANHHSPAGAAVDASYFAGSSPAKVLITEIDPDDPASPLSWTRDVNSVSGNDLVLSAALGGFDSTKIYRVLSQGYASATTGQRVDTYQADDADGLVANLRAPYGLAHFGIGQTTDFVASAATELGERPPTAAYGDGAPLDVGHAVGIAHTLNNVLSYGGAQEPGVVEESTFSGAGTWQLVGAEPVYIGHGVASAHLTRKLYLGPTIKSGSGTVSCRVTLARNAPRAADPDALDRDDIVRIPPFTEHTFTTSSATYVTATAVGLDTSHLLLGEGPTCGWGWVLVEVDANASYRGMGINYVGPQEAP